MKKIIFVVVIFLSITTNAQTVAKRTSEYNLEKK